VAHTANATTSCVALYCVGTGKSTEKILAGKDTRSPRQLRTLVLSEIMQAQFFRSRRWAARLTTGKNCGPKGLGWPPCRPVGSYFSKVVHEAAPACFPAQTGGCLNKAPRAASWRSAIGRKAAYAYLQLQHSAYILAENRRWVSVLGNYSRPYYLLLPLQPM
jgi:hypothetical protein